MSGYTHGVRVVKSPPTNDSAYAQPRPRSGRLRICFSWSPSWVSIPSAHADRTENSTTATVTSAKSDQSGAAAPKRPARCVCEDAGGDGDQSGEVVRIDLVIYRGPPACTCQSTLALPAPRLRRYWEIMKQGN